VYEEKEILIKKDGKNDVKMDEGYMIWVKISAQ
jgi:hypothetical protein